jgi:mono/diheme cytochrome c family protein
MKVLAVVCLSALLLTACERGAGPAAPTPRGEEVTPVTEARGDLLPEGDPAAGRASFLAFRCFSCHTVRGDDGLPPVSEAPDADLGPELTAAPAEQLALAIISRSHLPRQAVFAIEGPEMGDLGAEMTVEQLIDIVTYIRSREPVR